MKKYLIIVTLVVTVVSLSAYRQAQQQMSDVFQLMGISKTEASILMKENLIYVSLSTPPVSKLKTVAAGKRAALVQELGAYMKEYFKSKEVAAAYKEYRESLLPGKQDGIDVKARIEEIKRDIRNTEEDKKAAPADMKKMYEETIALLRKQLEVLQNPNHPDYAMYTGTVVLTPEQQEEINRQTKEFSKEYPEDVQQYLKLKLKTFLELTEDIDFNAKLVQRNGKWKFENPEYEAKDYNWKKCFRAGKETIEAARVFAQQWIKEIK